MSFFDCPQKEIMRNFSQNSFFFLKNFGLSLFEDNLWKLMKHFLVSESDQQWLHEIIIFHLNGD